MSLLEPLRMACTLATVLKPAYQLEVDGRTTEHTHTHTHMVATIDTQEAKGEEQVNSVVHQWSRSQSCQLMRGLSGLFCKVRSCLDSRQPSLSESERERERERGGGRERERGREGEERKESGSREEQERRKRREREEKERNIYSEKERNRGKRDVKRVIYI